MLQRIRDSLQGQRWLALGVLGALALVFAAWGAYGIVDLNFSGGAYAAKVGGEKISIEQARDAWTRQQEQWQQRLGDAELPDEFKRQMQGQLLEEMIRNSALTQRARELGYRVTDDQVREAAHQIPAFQIDGRYDPNVARERLGQMGMSLPAFEAEIRRDLQRTQVTRGLEASDFVTPLELERLHALEDEQREVRYLTLSAAKYAGEAPVDDAAVEAYLKKHQSGYMTPESVRLAYGELRLDQLAAQLSVAETDLREAYDKSKDSYVVPEKRRSRHILIKGEGADAQKKAEDVLAQAKGGKDFAALAKQYSADPGSAAQGGELGWGERGYYEAPFADALFGMKPGEVKGPVKTQYGYHIIQLEEIQPAKTRTFEEARSEIEAQLRRDRALDQLGDVQEQIARKLEEPGTDFDTLVKEFHLQTGEVASFQRTTGGAPLGAAPELTEIVFSKPVLEEKRIGGPVVLGEDRLIVVKALEHRQPAPKPVAQVRDEIVAAIRKERGTAAAEKAADTARARLLSGASFDDVAKESGVVADPARFIGRKDSSAPSAIRDLVFESARPMGKPVYRTVKLDDGDVAVMAITATRLDPEGQAPARKTGRMTEAAARHGAADVAAYIEAVRDSAKVRINPKAFE